MWVSGRKMYKILKVQFCAVYLLLTIVESNVCSPCFLMELENNVLLLWGLFYRFHRVEKF